MRPVITLCAVIAYLVSYSLFLYNAPYIPVKYSRIWVNGNFFFIISFLTIDLMAGFKSEFHKQFNFIGLCAVAFNFLLITAYYLFPFDSVLFKIVIYNLTVLMISAGILFSGIRHKLFKS